MYSYEDRTRAARLYLKLGKRIGTTIRQLGYPTKNSLTSWHREYERCHDLPAGYIRSRPRYSTEQKKAAVDHYLSHDRCAAATVLREMPRRRAISRSDTPWALSTWICIHCSFWSIASLCAQKADCTERWLRFTSREVAHYYFAPNSSG